ncbi:MULTISPECIES: type II secretion system secretin GspD [unclassified Janthinobacterium]|uniref:type II secretion system secretin GspD n=1 Tax=unclassified Janthinobacterium TaxID=2610881 RepID=UPI00161643FB|nr:MULTISPECIES: type II secretion system secretin GspD [unclassified Janthinobacterium]
MKKPSVSPNKSSFSLRRLSAAALLCCSVAGMPAPAWSAPGDEAALNFVGADIESVIKAVGHYTNINFVIDPRVKGTITLVSEKSISKTQAFGLLASALRLQGYAVVSGDGYAKVVPEADAKLQSVPTQVGSGASQVKGDQIATQVFYLSYESSANLLAVLRPLISPNNTINANPGNNSLVITDYADNLKRLAKIIAALDVPASTDLDVIPVRYAIASDLASMVNKLMEGGGGTAAGADAGKVSVLADPRTNSLVLRAPSVARANLAKSLISKLDQPTTQLGNVHVVYLKNADATKLAQTLRSVVTSDGTAAGGQQNNTNNASNQGLNNQGINSNNNSGGINSTGLGGNTQNGTSGGASMNNGPQQLSSGGAAGFIQADASTNTLILTCNEAVYRNLRAVIDQLDVRRAQVYIEALIVEVTSAKASEFGVQWAGLSGNSNSNYRVGVLQSFAGGTSNNIGAIATGKGAVLPTDGLNLGIFKQINGALGLGAIAHALESDGNANILSTPNLITLDNELATIKVGQNVPILTGQYTSTAGTNTNPFQTIDRKDVGLTLKVRPQISEGGTIKLSIYHETSSVDQATATAVSGITINNRVIENSVLADDGQVIVLGGLIQDSTSDNAEKVRGLGDIPVLGNLFRYQTRSRTKTNLMIFLRPVIVRSKEQSGSLASDRYDYMRAAEEMAVPATGNLMLKDLGTPVMPALQNGQPVGGGLMSRPLPPAPAPLGAPGNAVTPAAESQQQPQPQN